MLNKCRFPLYYFSNGTDHLEIDFIIEGINGLILIEEKSVNCKMAASRAVMEGKTKYKADKCYKIIKDNFGIGSFYESVSHYGLPFLLDIERHNLEALAELQPLQYPNLDKN